MKNTNCGCQCNCGSDPLNMGQNGLTPYIGENGNWWIGLKDTGTKAEGTDGMDGMDGADGVTPHIGDNGNWFIETTDTGVHAQGDDGADGEDGKDGKDGKDGADGENGADGEDGATPVIVQGSTTTLPANTPATATLVDVGDNTYKYNFGVPKGEDGAGGTGDLTNIHVWMETTAATVVIPPSEDIFGIGTPKGIGFYSNQGANIGDFAPAGAAFQTKAPGTYLVTYQFVVLDTKCKVCVRRKADCVAGGHIELSNTGGKILVAGAMVYLVSPEDVTNVNGVFSLANEDNTRPMPIDPKSFSWTITQLNKSYDKTFIRIPFN